MMKDRKEFEEFEMKLIWLDGDVICTSGEEMMKSPTSPDYPDWDPSGGGEGPGIEDPNNW